MVNLEETAKQYEPITSKKAWLVDTSSRILFYVPIIGVWEKFVADMENEEVLKSRLLATGLNFVIGRYHGKVREGLGYLTKTDENSSKKRKIAVDTLAGLAVGATTYPLVLGAAGVSLEEGLVALPFVLIYTTTTGRPFGKFQDFWRKLFGTTPIYDKTKKPSS